MCRLGEMGKLAAGVLLVLAPAMAGCQDALFPEQTARSPYERYGALRGDSRPATQTDAFGREKPALRERLRPLD